jgi:hypothetical protein
VELTKEADLAGNPTFKGTTTSDRGTGKVVTYASAFGFGE